LKKLTELINFVMITLKVSYIKECTKIRLIKFVFSYPTNKESHTSINDYFVLN